jgi:small subunit ribosomal protein S3
VKENYFVKDKLKKIAIENYLKKKLSSAGFIDVEVIKSVFNTRIVIYALKPGFVIGKKGSNIRSLTDELEKKFDLSKVHIEIGEIPNKNLDPKVIMENISTNIAKGISWKSVVYGALRQIKEAGAIGAEIIAKGNTSGKGQRKRKSRFAFGYMKKAGDQKNLVAIEKKTTFPSLGTIGITLRIVKPDIIFSDKIDVLQLSKTYKLQIQEEELLERQEDVKKDVDEKLSKKEKVVSKEKESEVKKDNLKEKIIEKKSRVKKKGADSKEKKIKTTDEKPKKETIEKIKVVKEDVSDENKKDVVAKNKKDVDATIKENTVEPEKK